jgi:hypothetical protein
LSTASGSIVSGISLPTGSIFTFSTDSGGNIEAWDVDLPFLSSELVTFNQPLCSTGGAVDAALFKATFLNTGCSVAIAGGSQAFNFNAPGAWSVSSTSTVPTPEPGSVSLLLIGLGSLGLMMVMRKRAARGLPQAT